MSNQPILTQPPRVPSSDFPSDTLKWMKENAGPKMGLKLMKCHKYFQHFPEFHYFIVKKVEYSENENVWKFLLLDDMVVAYEELEMLTSKNLWIIQWIRLVRASNIQLNYLIPKIAVCDIERLALYGQEISFNDFKFLTASGTVYMLILQYTKIFCNENGEPVFIDSILKCVPNVTKLEYFNADEPNILTNFFNALKKFDVSKFKKISFKMTCYHDYEMFSKFMNKNPHIGYKLSFVDDDSLSNVKMEILKYNVQRIIDKGITENHPPPDITYPGQLDIQWRALRTLRNNYKNLKKIRKLKT